MVICMHVVGLAKDLGRCLGLLHPYHRVAYNSRLLPTAATKIQKQHVQGMVHKNCLLSSPFRLFSRTLKLAPYHTNVSLSVSVCVPITRPIHGYVHAVSVPFISKSPFGQFGALEM